MARAAAALDERMRHGKRELKAEWEGTIHGKGSWATAPRVPAGRQHGKQRHVRPARARRQRVLVQQPQGPRAPTCADGTRQTRWHGASTDRDVCTEAEHAEAVARDGDQLLAAARLRLQELMMNMHPQLVNVHVSGHGHSSDPRRPPDCTFDMDRDALTTFLSLKTILSKAGCNVRSAHVSGKSMEDGAPMTPGAACVTCTRQRRSQSAPCMALLAWRQDPWSDDESPVEPAADTTGSPASEATQAERVENADGGAHVTCATFTCVTCVPPLGEVQETTSRCRPARSRPTEMSAHRRRHSRPDGRAERPHGNVQRSQASRASNHARQHMAFLNAANPNPNERSEKSPTLVMMLICACKC